MSDLELEELRAVWQSKTYQAEVEALKSDINRSVTLQRLRNIFEILGAIIAVPIIALFIYSYWSAQVLIMGGVLLALLVGSLWYRFRIQSRISSEPMGSAQDLILLALQHSQLRIKELKLGLSLLFISAFLGVFFGVALKTLGIRGNAVVDLNIFKQDLFLVVISIIFLVAVIWMLMKIRREKKKSEDYWRLSQKFSDTE